jgi:primosomal protein N' (replication factor Y) (superfamily II helicase)
VGSLVQVPFHGKATRGWVLGPTDDVPDRMLAVKKVVSPVRFFDARMLGVARWMAERYVAPLATCIARLSPPRVASEEKSLVGEGKTSGGLTEAVSGRGPLPLPQREMKREGEGRDRRSYTLLRGPLPSPSASVALDFDRYRRGASLVAALEAGIGGVFVVRPAPLDEQSLAVSAVGIALAAGRSAIVLVPEAEPLPATAEAIRDAFGDSVAMFLGGSERIRYRTWLGIKSGRYRVVVGSRAAVFAPVSDLGVIWVARESHPGHREERSPATHTRDVAVARARIEGAVCVLSALCPSGEAFALGASEVAPLRRVWPPVEVVRPGPEGRAPRLVAALKEVRRGFLYSPLPGYGVARVCRTCGEPARCAVCGGTLRMERGEVRCVVCEAPGKCANCGGVVFGVVRGGAERVEEWAGRVARVPVRRAATPDDSAGRGTGDAVSFAGDGILIGGPEAVKDVPPPGLDLVGILDADLAARRPGLASGERSLALWMEAAAWAGSQGRVIVQSSRPNDPLVQALVAGNPGRFHRADLPRRAAAGFPAGFPVFRVVGDTALEDALAQLRPVTLLATRLGDASVCLVTVRPDEVAAFGRAVRDLAVRGTVTRVEAEPHL